MLNNRGNTIVAIMGVALAVGSIAAYLSYDAAQRVRGVKLYEMIAEQKRLLAYYSAQTSYSKAKANTLAHNAALAAHVNTAADSATSPVAPLALYGVDGSAPLIPAVGLVIDGWVVKASWEGLVSNNVARHITVNRQPGLPGMTVPGTRDVRPFRRCITVQKPMNVATWNLINPPALHNMGWVAAQVKCPSYPQYPDMVYNLLSVKSNLHPASIYTNAGVVTSEAAATGQCVAPDVFWTGGVGGHALGTPTGDAAYRDGIDVARSNYPAAPYNVCYAFCCYEGQ